MSCHQLPDGRHAFAVAHGVLRHGAEPAVDLHDLWTAPNAQNLPQLLEDEGHQPGVLKRRRFGKVKAEASVDGLLVCSGELMFSLVD
jgi:hypothetical protein